MSKRNVDIVLERGFQKEVASLILKDGHFASKFMSIVLDNLDLQESKVRIFTDKKLDTIIKVFCEIYEQGDKIFPTPGVLKNYIGRKDWDQEDIVDLVAMVDEVVAIEVPNKTLHEKEIVGLVKSVVSAKYLKDIQTKVFKNPNIETLSDVPNMFQEAISKTNQIGFSSTDTIFANDIFSIIEEATSEETENLPTGFKEIDENLNGGGKTGGICRNEVTTILSPVNDGKSTVLTNISTHNGLIGNKVLHISLEGKKLQPIMRSISKAAQVSYKRMMNYASWKKDGNLGQIINYLKDEEVKRLKEAEKTFGNNVRFCHEIHKNALEDLMPFIREKFNEENFDLLVIDYAQKITSKKVFPRHDLMYEYIFAELEKMAVEFNCAVLTAMQVKNEGIKYLAERAAEGVPYPIFLKNHCADSKKPVDISATVLAWCRTDEERKEAKGRLAIIKQREGLTQYQVGYAANWENMDLAGGSVYWKGLGEGDNSNNQRQKALENARETAAWGQKGDVSQAIEDNNIKIIMDKIEDSRAFREAYNCDKGPALLKLMDLLEKRRMLLGVKENLEINKDSYSSEEFKEEMDDIILQIRDAEKDPELEKLINEIWGKNLLFFLSKVNPISGLMEEIRSLDEEKQEDFKNLLMFGDCLLDISEFSLRFTEDE